MTLPRKLELPWAPLAVTALLSTVSVGALSGALDLWALRVRLHAVPLDHLRGHALAQVFGFMLLLTMGVSLHLTPRFFGTPPPSLALVRGVTWPGVAGLVLLIVGRLGALVPGSGWLGSLGAVLLSASVGCWVLFVVTLRLLRTAPAEPMHDLLLAGTGWWALSVGLLWAWQWAQWVGGPVSGLPFAAVLAPGLYGGLPNWVFGVYLRAGVCSLRLQAPSLGRQRWLLRVWQLAPAAQLTLALSSTPWVRALALGATAVALVGTAWVLAPRAKPFAVADDSATMRRAIFTGFVFAELAAGLSVFGAAGELGLVATPALLEDGARHTWTMGVMLLVVFSFAGRMLPGFAGVPHRAPWLHASGLLFVGAGALLRLTGLFAPARWALALSGTSGALGALGVTACVVGLLMTVRAGFRRRQAPPQSPTLRVSLGA
jgi:hypothetical protein